MLRDESNFDKFPLNSIEITTNVGCKLDCRFCPQTAALQAYFGSSPSKEKPPVMLTFENFKTIYSRLEENAVTSFSGISEPFVNPDLVAMIRYAHDHGSQIDIATTLTATSKADIDNIKDIPFLSFQVHIPDAMGNAKFHVTDDYLKVLAYTLEKMPISAFSCHGITHPAVEKMVRNTGIHIFSSMHDRAGSIIDPEANVSTKTEGRIICALNPRAVNSFHNLTPVAPSVRPDGRVVPCCMDFEMKHTLGNLFSQSWSEIQHGEEYTRFFQGFDENNNSLCRTCSSAISVTALPSYRLRSFLDGTDMALRNALLKLDDKNILRGLLDAPCTAVMGLGEVFSGNYFKALWDEALNAKVFVDNNKNSWGKPVKGMKLPSETGTVESPEILQRHPGVFVVTFVGKENHQTLAQQLDAMNIPSANIFDIFALLIHPDILRQSGLHDTP